MNLIVIFGVVLVFGLLLGYAARGYLASKSAENVEKKAKEIIDKAKEKEKDITIKAKEKAHDVANAAEEKYNEFKETAK